MQNKNYVLTFDIDWAPDFAILKCLDMLDMANKKATFFTTHNTPVNEVIVSCGHNLGIHPNFLPGSSHGNDVEAIMCKCMSFAPDAWCMRTHALVQSTPLLLEIFQKFPQIKLDVSLLMHQSEFSHKVNWCFSGVSAQRLLYNWEDDAQFHLYSPNMMPRLFFGNLTVFDFHPIHVYLNSSDGNEYARLKYASNNERLPNLSEVFVQKYIHHGLGTADYLKNILMSDNSCIELKDLC